MSDGGELFGMTGLRQAAAEKVVACAEQLGLELAGRMESPIRGAQGQSRNPGVVPARINGTAVGPRLREIGGRRGRSHNGKMKTLCGSMEKV